MVSSASNQTEANSLTPSGFSASETPKSDWLAQMDLELMFRLIDSILPFEACLYHQLLPLRLEGSRLRLGMVNPEDGTALDYVRWILAYMNCSLVPQLITSEAHHAVLTAYLNHAGNQKQALKNLTPELTLPASSSPEPIQSVRAVPDKPADPEQSSPHPSDLERHLLERQLPQPDSHPPKQQPPMLDRNMAPTLLVDSPQELGSSHEGAIESQASAASVPESANPIPPVNGRKGFSINSDQPQTTLVLIPETSLADTPSTGATPGTALPVLEVEPQYLSDPIDALATLSPHHLLQELLGRLLVDGIGRLYFERQQHHGRILWSQNGVLQSVLRELPVDLIQGVIDELKQLTHLPSAPCRAPKQVEIERLYQRQRLLLRLRIIPGPHGEEATLQVLRGAALKFYQQQQLASLSRDALGVAQELQRKISELRTRTQRYPMLSSEQLTVLPELHEVLRDVEHQLETLRAMQTHTT